MLNRSMRRNFTRKAPRMPASKNNGATCGICGLESLAIHLTLVNGILVNRRHAGCYDRELPYQGLSELKRGPHYGEQPE